MKTDQQFPPTQYIELDGDTLIRVSCDESEVSLARGFWANDRFYPLPGAVYKLPTTAASAVAKAIRAVAK